MRLYTSIAVAVFPKWSVAANDSVALDCCGTKKNISHVPLVALYAKGMVKMYPVEFWYEPVAFPKLSVNREPLGYWISTGSSRLVPTGTVALVACTRKLNRAGTTNVV